MFLADLPQTDDRIAAAARGDRAAAAEVCREILPRVRNLVRYLVRGDQIADDIAQEALIAVLRGLGSYRGEGRFEAWVDRIAARATFAALRRLRGERGRLEAPDPEAVERARADTDPGLGAGNSPGAGDLLLRRQLADLLDQLPGEQREALVLHFSAGMTVPEIAELTGAPFETVRSRLRLAKQTLRDALGGRDARRT
ncbi:MAG: sigma-70 family RNA polymerase sigma factor [Kofleriaceae bacterium]|nr:sigma-70 family RNA polymerase sigma factor [Myxococcales bacterium]MCB9559045.1 sigma-70 family RNA polymerase sigma factor [Kofleriaceae bacterium]MCB9575274.1 sigma-70 family RNA polymerase sigma factor [Kofleriaceae bacterium]